MAKKSVTQRVAEIDPMFYIPDDVEELRYKEPESIDFDDEQDPDSEADIFLTSDTVLEDDSEEDLDYGPDVPAILSVAQTFRRAPGGFNVIDATFEIDLNDPNLEFEFKAAKV